MLFQSWYVMLVGLPGVGKSTIIGKIKHPTNALILSTDMFIEEQAEIYGKTYNEVFSETIGLAQKVMMEKFDRLIINNQSMIHDQTNLTIKKRKSFLQKLPSSYYKICLNITCNAHDHEIRLQRPGKIIPPSVMDMMKVSYEIPTKNEGFDYVETINTSCKNDFIFGSN